VERSIRFYDVSLRDGNHALKHQLSAEFVAAYAALSGKTSTWALEVGHGNGLGGSSHLVGKSAETDQNLLESARAFLPNSQLAVHVIPGFATIDRDIQPAVDVGVDVFRIASHASEATVCQTHIEYLSNLPVEVHGVLMMSHTVTIAQLVEQAKILLEFGATAIVFMDSAGHYRPSDVGERVRALRSETAVDVGFHAHNNLGLAVQNAIAAIESGASIVDVSSRGLGAGAGNVPFELLALALGMDETAPEEFSGVLALADLVSSNFPHFLPQISPSSIRSGLLGVFSGYAPQVEKLSEEFGVSAAKIWASVAARKLVAGQESMLREIAQDLQNL
jgi:4-hydroxy 2-oxovalerate aldolase